MKILITDDHAVVRSGLKQILAEEFTKAEFGETVYGGPSRGPGRNLNVMQFIERGFALATFNYTDVEPDALNSLSQGVRSAFLKPGQREPAPDEWGAIAAWGWGASRVIDYLETDPQIDAKRVAIMGASRLGNWPEFLDFMEKHLKR